MNRYNRDFYVRQREGSLSSAREILPLVLEIVQPSSIVDVGCGLGNWLSVCQELGIEDFLGIDGSYLDTSMLYIPKEKFIAANLQNTIEIGRTFDLVISLEVVEHIPRKYENIFIDSLVRLGPVILFSAAIPFQMGVGHLNEQWQDHWVEHFKKRQYQLIDFLRTEFWNNKNVMWWYAQNMLLFVRRDFLAKHVGLQKMFEQKREIPLRIVHPYLFEGTANPRKMALKKALYAILFAVIRIVKRFFEKSHCSFF